MKTKIIGLSNPLQNFERELLLRGYSEETIKNYLHYNLDFINFIHKPVNIVTSKDIKTYLFYLLKDKNAQEATINSAISALKFYYDYFLARNLFSKIKRAKLPKKIPEVLSKKEIQSMIDTTMNLKHRLLIELLYSSGLRVSEAVKIKIEDIDIEERIARIRKGKGKKDRLVIISNKLIKDLRKYLFVRDDNNSYLFNKSFYKKDSSNNSPKSCKKYRD